MRKYRPPLTIAEQNELVRLSQLNFDGWSEADVREEFIVPLLSLLGYRKELDYSVSREDSYKLNPLFIQLGRSRIKLDYICSVRKQKFWIIESKPGGNGSDSYELTQDDIAQAYFYSLHPSVDTPYFLVTNGWYIHLYDRDRMHESLEPLLVIKNRELPTEFMKLDAVIGSSQLLYYLKQRILKTVEMTLSAEVHLDRLDEFVHEIKMSINHIRPRVLENFRANAQVQESARQKHLEEVLQKEDLDLLVSSVFMASTSIGFIKMAANILANRMLTAPKSRQFLFMTKLLIEETRPVRIQYYYHVLEFLIQVHKIDSSFVHQGESIQTIIEKWTEMCLFHFWNRKDLRYLWIMEGLLGRLAIRLMFLSSDAKKIILARTDSQIYYAPEEEIAWMGPNPAKNLIEVVDRIILTILGNLVDKYMSEGKVKESLIRQEIVQLEALVKTVEETSEAEYRRIRQELGTSWGELEWYDSINVTFDKLSSGVCEVLSQYPDVLRGLNDNIKKRIAQQSRLKVVNYAQKCLDIVGDQSTQYVIADLDIHDYFNIDCNPYVYL